MSEFHKDRELEHMFELQGNNRSGCPDHTADIWDKRKMCIRDRFLRRPRKVYNQPFPYPRFLLDKE